MSKGHFAVVGFERSRQHQMTSQPTATMTTAKSADSMIGYGGVNAAGWPAKALLAAIALTAIRGSRLLGRSVAFTCS